MKCFCALQDFMFLKLYTWTINHLYVENLFCCFFAFADVSQSVRIPVLIGSGVTYDNVERYLDANGMIIGSHFKKGGHWADAVDPERVKRFMGKIHELRKWKGSFPVVTIVT